MTILYICKYSFLVNFLSSWHISTKVLHSFEVQLICLAIYFCFHSSHPSIFPRQCSLKAVSMVLSPVHPLDSPGKLKTHKYLGSIPKVFDLVYLGWDPVADKMFESPRGDSKCSHDWEPLLCIIDLIASWLLVKLSSPLQFSALFLLEDMWCICEF